MATNEPAPGVFHNFESLLLLQSEILSERARFTSAEVDVTIRREARDQPHHARVRELVSTGTTLNSL